MPAAPAPITLYVDADACPVKTEIYRVARRHAVPVKLVANAWLALPGDPLFELVTVDGGFDAADDWIAARAGPGAVVVTADIPLAARCVKAGATVLAPTGRPFTQDSVGMALALRDLMQGLRDSGQRTRGPPPFAARDRARFLAALETALQRLKRSARRWNPPR